MQVSELKKTLHEKIDKVEDSKLLESLIATIDLSGIDVFQIPDNWRDGIEAARSEIKNGDFYTLEDYEMKYKKWLKED
ncbi:MAG: hypothetical protein H7Y07_18835 [Pyrinomonadaceae bacterium]|nr:hypothetical protein [Sphingobacteriaceae bacterium]